MNTWAQGNINKGLYMQWRVIMLMLVVLVTPALLVQAHDGGFHINGAAWVDDNGDGIRDTTENGLGNIAVYLFDDAGSVVDTQITDVDGNYVFHITAADDYTVQFAAQSDYDFSPQSASSDTDVDTGGRSSVISFSASTDGGSVTIDNTLNTFVPATTSEYLTNPAIGWQQTPGRQNFLLPETVAFPNRENISWKILNPSENTYDWTELDNRLNQAIAEDKQFSFRVYSMRGEQWGGHQVPQWVLNKGANLLSGAPNYSSCVYQEEWARFINEIRQRYDGNPNIAYIDISGYSDFNEWSWNGQTVWDDNYPNNLSLDGQARQRLADIFIGGSKNQHECSQNGSTRSVSYNYPGFSQTQLIMPYAGVRQALWYVTDKRADVGIRYDCLGRPGDDTMIMDQIGEIINNTWQNAPIVYELCPGTINYNQTQNLLEMSHGSMVHDNENQRNQSETEDFMLYTGYRYIVSNAMMPAEVAMDGTVDVEMTWQNIGYAPAYASMGNLFELHTYLVAPDGTVVQDVVSDSIPTDWMPATNIQGGNVPNNTISESLPVSGVDAGQYTVEVAIVNTRNDEKINLGLQGRNAAGRYAVGNVMVVNEPGTGSGGTGSSDDEIVDAGYIPVQQNVGINLTLNALTVTVDEGGIATLTGTVKNATTMTASVGDISMNGTDWGFMYNPADGPGESQAVVISASNDSESISSTFNLTVNNTNPTATFQLVDNTHTAGPPTAPAGLRVDVIFSNPTDSSAVDTAAGFIYAVDCNSDGTFESAGTAPNLTCTYAAAGSYTITGRISDKDAGFSDYTLSVTLDDPTDDSDNDDDDTPTARALNSFVMQAIGRLRLMDNSRILSGHISSNDRVVVRPGTQVINPDSYVVTDYLNLQDNSSITGAEFNRKNNKGSITGTQINPATLPVSSTPALPMMTPGTDEIIVNSNQSRTLDAGAYGLLYLKSGATITLTGGIYEFASWDIRKNARVEFAAPSEVRIADNLKTAAGVTIMPQANTTQPHGSVLYIAGSNGGDGSENATPRAVQFGNENTIQASVYAPNGMLRIGNDSNVIGAFVGQWVYLGYRSQVMLDSVFGLNLDFAPYASNTDNTAPDSDNDGISDAEDICPNNANHDTIGDPCNPDEDNDGFIDTQDVCPTEAGTDNGCPVATVVDSDNDSIPDDSDVCPNDALHDTVGDPCNHDEDNDTFMDNVDACPTVAGNNNGCPVADADGDGFSDNSDSCPNVYGTNNGCPDAPDVDNDGFADTEDACPTVYGTDNGCPVVVDSDNDGFADNSDSCPNVYGTDNGCPVNNNNGGNTGNNNNNGGNTGNNNNNGGNTGNNNNTGDNTGNNNNNGGNTGNNNSGADSDWDGVADNVDLCPNDWGDSTSAPGCMDDDGDGIPDKDDVCPYTAIHDSYGDPCESDEDWDNVPDVDDACPATWGRKSNGCQ